MNEHTQIDEEPPVLNVIQIVALNFCFCIGLLVTLRLKELSWGASIGLAWIGGALLTAATAVAFVVIRGRINKSGPVQQRVIPTGPELVAPIITDALQVWDADRMAEMQFSLDHAVINPQATSKPASTVATVRLWVDDARAESAARPSQPGQEIIHRNQRVGSNPNGQRVAKG